MTLAEMDEKVSKYPLIVGFEGTPAISPRLLEKIYNR